MWTLAVRDNGIGLDMHYAERIFKVFKRLHGRDVPGIGMGLAICRKIIEDHGGRIWVESVPEQGATFKFTLPATRSLSEPAREREEHTNSPSGV
jgi:light-regulated signal transduction histidine kinase (bacteriophytochrome)